MIIKSNFIFFDVQLNLAEGIILEYAEVPFSSSKNSFLGFNNPNREKSRVLPFLAVLPGQELLFVVKLK